jgi:hypothetical protein
MQHLHAWRPRSALFTGFQQLPLPLFVAGFCHFPRCPSLSCRPQTTTPPRARKRTCQKVLNLSALARFAPAYTFFGRKPSTTRQPTEATFWAPWTSFTLSCGLSSATQNLVRLAATRSACQAQQSTPVSLFSTAPQALDLIPFSAQKPATWHRRRCALGRNRRASRDAAHAQLSLCPSLQDHSSAGARLDHPSRSGRRIYPPPYLRHFDHVPVRSLGKRDVSYQHVVSALQEDSTAFPHSKKRVPLDPSLRSFDESPSPSRFRPRRLTNILGDPRYRRRLIPQASWRRAVVVAAQWNLGLGERTKVS